METGIINKKRIINEHSLANLKPIKPGEVRNPQGRKPKADCLLSCIKAELSKKHLNIKGGLTNEQMIAAALIQKASMGDLKAIELTLSYTAVKPIQALDVTSKGEAINGHWGISESDVAAAVSILDRVGAFKTSN